MTAGSTFRHQNHQSEQLVRKIRQPRQRRKPGKKGGRGRVWESEVGGKDSKKSPGPATFKEELEHPHIRSVFRRRDTFYSHHTHR